jgi:hypothetical protein
VKVFNRNLREYLKAYNNTLIVEVASNRDYFTRHGLHLNRKGKDSIAKKIAVAIQDQLNTQKCAPSIMSHNPSTTTISTQDQADTATIHLKESKPNSVEKNEQQESIRVQIVGLDSANDRA